MNYDHALSECAFLSADSNPVFTQSCDFLLALGQYSALPFEIAAMLERASQRTTCWPAVSEELALNCSEERGSETGGIPHVEILVAGVARELGLDLRTVEHSRETSAFIDALRQQVEEGSTARVAGTIFALEASAIAELKVIGRMIEEARKTATAANNSTEENNRWLSMPLRQFIRMHTDGFEVEHRSRLWTALQSCEQNEEEQREFDDGFRFVLQAMDSWWKSIAGSSRLH